RAGDRLLPALPRAPGDRTGLRIDVRDHRGAEPGVAAGRVEARQEPPGLQRVRELARLAAEVCIRSGTRGLGSRSLSRSAARDVSDGILYWPLHDSGAPPTGMSEEIQHGSEEIETHRIVPATVIAETEAVRHGPHPARRAPPAVPVLRPDPPGR